MNTHDTVVNKMQHAEGSSTLGLHRYKHWRYVTHRKSLLMFSHTIDHEVLYFSF